MPDDAPPPPPATRRTVTVEIDADDDAFLEEIAGNMEISKSDLLREALSGYVAWQRREMELTEHAIRELDEGKGVPHEQVVAWIESWGTADERPRPG